MPPPRSVFRPWHVLIATAVGGPFGGGAVLALNARRLGQSPARWLGCLAFGAAGSASVIFARWTMGRSWWVPLYVAGLLVMGVLASALQRAEVTEHLGRGGRIASAWTAFAIGLAAVPVTMIAGIGAIALGVAIRGPIFWSYVMKLQPRTVYWSCDFRSVRPAAGDSLAPYVKTDENICFDGTVDEMKSLCHATLSTVPCDHARALGACWSNVGSWWWYPSSAITSAADVKRVCTAADHIFEEK